MKFNATTYWISVATMILYILYIMSAMGLVGLILSLSGALIAASFVDSFEIVTVSVVVLGILYVFITRTFLKPEGFTTDGTPKEITGVVDAMARSSATMNKRDRVIDPRNIRDLTVGSRRPVPTGVLSSGIEGFENVSSQPPAEGAPKESAPGPANSAPAVVQQSQESFSANQAGLFKLGEMPSESADGPHIDAGSTLMKAMSALNSDQISSMTTDTKSLLETQQNLMGMLKSMQPILKDGRKLLDTFSGIFGTSQDSGIGGLTLGKMTA